MATGVDCFIGAGGASDGLIAIGDAEILVADVEPAAARTLAQALAEGVVEVPGAKHVAFAALSSVHANQHRDDVTIKYWDGKTTQAVYATFADGAARDRALTSLERRFAGRMRRDETQYGAARAIGIPLVSTVGIALFSWLLVGAAQELADGAAVPIRHAVRPQTAGAAALLSFIGPIGTALIGMIATAAGLRWAYQRWQKPPLMIRLTRR